MESPAPSPSSPNPNQPTPLTLQGPVRVLVEQQGGRVGVWLRRLFWFVVALVLLSNTFYSRGERTGLEEQYHSLSRFSLDKIAIISLDGVILGGEGFVKKQIDHVRDDARVKAVVLRVDSPGGTVTGSDYIYHHLRKLREERQIPIVVSMGAIAASGGYYVSMAAGGENTKNIFAEPTTWTGSIGVIIPHYDLSGLLANLNVKDDSIASAKFKQMGSPTRALTELERAEERAVLQELVDESFAGFKEIVLNSRPSLKADPQQQEIAFSGRVFTAKQAREHGLVDELGFIDAAIDRAIELAKLAKSNVQVVKYAKPTTLADQLIGMESRSASTGLDLASLIDLTAPRAYYLCTVLPYWVRSVSGAVR